MQEIFKNIQTKVEEVYKVKVLSLKQTAEFCEPYIMLTLDSNHVNSEQMSEIALGLANYFPEISETYGFIVESKGLEVNAKNQAEFEPYIGQALCFTAPQFKGCARLVQLDEEHTYFETKIKTVKKTLKIKYQNLSNITLE